MSGFVFNREKKSFARRKYFFKNPGTLPSEFDTIPLSLKRKAVVNLFAKKFFSAIMIFALMIFSAQVEASDEPTIDYGNSKIFSQAEMDFCIAKIKSDYKDNGAKILNIRYAGDEYNSHENRKYLNSLADSRGFKKKFSKCMVFLIDYRTPPASDDGKFFAWEPDTVYKDWQYWFGFYKPDGEWKYLTSGY